MRAILPILFWAVLYGTNVAECQDYEWHREELQLHVDAMTNVDLPDNTGAPLFPAIPADILDQDSDTDVFTDNGSATITPLGSNISTSASTATQSGSAVTHGTISVNPNDQSVFQITSILNSGAAAAADVTATESIRAFGKQYFGSEAIPVSCRYRLTSPTLSDGTDALGEVAFSIGTNISADGGSSWFSMSMTLEVKCDEDAEGTAPTENLYPDFVVDSDGEWGLEVTGWRLLGEGEEQYLDFVTEYVTPDLVDIITFDGVDGFLLPGLKVGCVVDLWASPFHFFATEVWAQPDNSGTVTGITTVDLNVTASDP
jgi:hypothetical protein